MNGPVRPLECKIVELFLLCRIIRYMVARFLEICVQMIENVKKSGNIDRMKLY